MGRARVAFSHYHQVPILATALCNKGCVCEDPAMHFGRQSRSLIPNIAGSEVTIWNSSAAPNQRVEQQAGVLFVYLFLKNEIVTYLHLILV